MDISRRSFVKVAGSVLALTVIQNAGLARAEKEPEPRKPFDAGPVSDYSKPGVYEKFKDTQGVILVSDGKTLVALSTRCPHQGGKIGWNADDKKFVCEKHKAQFDGQGINQAGAKAKRPMERFAIRATGPDKKQVEVDPGKVFRKDQDQWNDGEASLRLT